MATKKPRLAISLSVEARAALERFSQATGMAASSFVSELVQDSIPVIVATADAIEAAKKSPAKAASMIGETMARGVVDVVQAKLALDAKVAKRSRIRKRPG